ncbi:TolC family protein [Aquimarina sp. W85]|uniref:TolC family protein n=1 Tax=Aquimarina rhodophyticola TaxID=3342246 RepID=UPI00366AA6E0
MQLTRICFARAISINFFWHASLYLLFSSFGVTAQTLHDYQREALTNNPELKALQYHLEQSEEKISVAGSLTNTKISAGYFVQEPETRTGAQKARFSAQQSVPLFGIRKAQKETARLLSSVEQNNLEVAKNVLFLDIKRTYYNIYALKAKQNILKARYQLLETYREIGLTALSTNRATAVDILKINIALNEVRNKEEILKGEILSTEKEFNSLLNRDGFEAIHVVDNLFIPEEEPTMVLNETSNHPELLRYEYLTNVVDARLKLNKREALPSLGFGLDYIIVQERTDMEISDNGKDIVMPMVSVSIPLFTNRYKSQSKQFVLEQNELSQQYEAVHHQLENRLERAINERITSRINYDTQQKNIEQAKQVEQILRARYETSQIDFDQILAVQNMLLDFEYNKVEAIKEYFIQTAVIAYLNVN